MIRRDGELERLCAALSRPARRPVGIIDVEDCVEGGRHLIVVGCAGPDRLVISGGSAGG
jgi:dipeptidyl aminopeptidase/acylaminoacyl peptidase